MLFHSEESKNTLPFPNNHLYLLRGKLNATNPLESYKDLDFAPQIRTSVSKWKMTDTLKKKHACILQGVESREQ